MSKRSLSLWLGVSIAASVAAFGQSGTGYVFELPGQNSSSGQIYGFPYSGNPLTASVNALGPNGTYQLVAKPDGTGYYVVGTTLQVTNSTFTTFSTVNGIAAAPTAVVASPDGNFAVVGAGDVYILSASTGAILLDINVGGTPVAIAISPDSKYAYVLANTITASNLTQINLATKTKVNTLQFPFGDVSSLGFSPLGLLYAAGVNRLYEINPTTLAITTGGTIALNATPGPLHFTPDGTTLYFANITSNITGPSFYQVTLATHTANPYPAVANGTPPLLSDVIVAGNSRVFAISASATTLYDVSTSPLGLAVSTSIGTLSAQAQNVLAATVSNELPSAVYLYLQIGGSQNSLYSIQLSNNQTSQPTATLNAGGILQFVGVPPTSGAASFITYNTNQTVAQGATSLPLMAQVLDTTGRPIFDLTVNFTVASSSGIVINTPAPTTNANGWVETTIVAPATAGTYTVTLTAGSANTSFTINVPGTGGSGGGPTGVSQVFVVSGDGQLVGFGHATDLDPLTVLVTDLNGAPLEGVTVTFAVTSGTGFCNGSFITDSNGLASAIFFGSNPAANMPFEVDQVVATTPYGAVTFYEIEYPTIVTGSSTGAASFPPQILAPAPGLAPPTSSFDVTVAEGSVAQNAFSASITVAPGIIGALTPIPFVGARIVTPDDSFTASPYASCQGNPLSDQNGIVRCNVVGTCGAALGVTQAVYFAVGDQQQFQGHVTVTQGTAQMISILSGNNQTGPAGGTTPTALLAQVTDSCGHAIQGAPVTWAVTQGSATLSNLTSVSSSAGYVSATVNFGATAGTVVVTVTLGTSSIQTFTLTSQAVANQLTIVSGNNQTGTTSAAFPAPLTVQINDTNNKPIPGVTVNFAVTSGNATISGTTAVTNAQGQASIIASAAQTSGSITVTASYGSLSVVFSLNAVPLGPQLTVSAIQNAASFQPGLVPCGLATATGSGIAPNIIGSVSGANFFGPLQTTLDGVSITVNGTPAPIYQLSNTNGKQQVTFQTPCQAAPGNNGVVQVSVSGAPSTVTGVTILAAQPGIFYYTAPDGNSYGQVISAADGSYITAANPAKRGGTYYLIATGLGQVTPATATNSAGINGQNVVNTVIVGVANAGVPVTAAYYQPGEVGVYVVGFTIPANLTLLTNNGADQPLALAEVVNGQTIFGNPLFIPVQ